MANIDQFVHGPDRYNIDELTHDLLGMMLDEHAGWENAITHREICHYYFDPRPIYFEDKFLISNILQNARGIMQDAGWFLDYRKGRGWFAVRTTEEAFEHVRRYAKREVNLHRRLQTKTHIAIGDHYRLPPSNPLIQAIHGVTPVIQQLEETVNNPPELEEGHSDES